jgi:hypothetical protein
MRSILDIPDRLAPHAATLGFQQFDDGDQPRPRHDALHLAEELLSPCSSFFIAYSALANLRWLIILFVLFGARSSTHQLRVAPTTC